MDYRTEWISRDGEFVAMVLDWLNSMSDKYKYRPATVEENKRHMDIVFYNAPKNEFTGIDVKKPKRIKRLDYESSADTITVEFLNPFGFNGWSRPESYGPNEATARKVMQFFATDGVIDRVGVWALPDLANRAIQLLGYDVGEFIRALESYSASPQRGTYGSVATLCRVNNWNVNVDGFIQHNDQSRQVADRNMGVLRTRQLRPDGVTQSDLFVALPIDKIKPDGMYVIPEAWRQPLTNACWKNSMIRA